MDDSPTSTYTYASFYGAYPPRSPPPTPPRPEPVTGYNIRFVDLMAERTGKSMSVW